MTPRNRAILIVGLLLLLIGIVIAALLLLRNAVPEEDTTFEAPEDAPTDITEPPPSEIDFENPLITEEPPEPGATAARQMAELFAERYGSYSNQGDYQNLRDLLPVMTARYRQSTEAFLSTAETTPGQTFDGVTSVKISTDVRSSDADSAVIAVTLQQERTTGAAAPTIGYRTLRMELVLVGEDWRVDAAAWEN